MVTQNSSNVVFQHLVHIPRCECVFCSARDPDSGRLRLYLAFHEGRIYARNGINGTWDELSEEQTDIVRRLLDRAITTRSIPCYSTN